MGNYVFYHYSPSIPAAVATISLFAFSALLHSYQMVRRQTWFMIPFVVGCVVEAVGYAGRIISSNQGTGNYTLVPYIVQYIAILVAPALLAASIYMELGRISMMVNGDEYLIIRRRWMTRIFVMGDVLSFFTQGAGGGFMAKASRAKMGTTIIVVGLFIQVIFFGCFVIAALIFHKRLHDRPTKEVLVNQPPYRKHLLALYATSLLIFVRSIVRIVEFQQGGAGYIITHEVFLYVFDALLMVTAVLLMNLIHPGEIQRLLRSKTTTKGYELTDNSDGSQEMNV
ncbi:hypothetical protein FSARC_1342 [Fusarium sarcochroum]|uniref:Uncharacterized protein n=1 Tax=Fusarium sarcochroum TaxID=1208366 RepID=A0A8H4U9H9_9HYPO|nr:hypothetical protein FSARC_1342 [Fusarium sarcochroum]